MPGMYPRTSTVALTNATLPYIITIASKPIDVLLSDEIYRGALNTYDGNVTNEAVAAAHAMPYKGIL
jgi:alanine dehydrogenase